MAAFVDSANLGATLDIDLFSLGEVVRSYFLDAIRYKEYHFDPRDIAESSLVKTKLADHKLESLHDLDPLSPLWTELVHTTANINSSKVAAYTVKWILRHKPISVISTMPDLAGADIEPRSSDIPNLIPYLNSINENYALQCALFALEIEAGRVSRNKLEELLYCLKFRAFDESSYFMILSEDYLCSDFSEKQKNPTKHE